MSIEGKKVKQHIGKLKEALDNIASNDIDSLSLCYRLLVISEIIQRGVVVPLDCDDGQLLQTIISTAGKVLLDENQVKPPLIAGAAVVSALIAQKLANGMLTVSENKSLLSKENFESAFQRAKDVDDTRLSCLLNLATKQGIENDGIQNSEGVALLLKRIAFGNNLRAASFSNPEQPPVFKRSLDSCLEANVTLMKLVRKAHGEDDVDVATSISGGDDYLSFYTRDAITPISNLIRIAESKQNPKRVSELSLRITQSYVGGEADYKQSDVLSDSGCQLWNDINKVFVDIYAKQGIGVVGDGPASNLKLIQEAKKSLDKVDLSNFDEDDDALILLHKLLKVRVEFSHEDTLASIIGNERYVAARNRSGLSSGTSTKTGFEEMVKRELVAGTLPVVDSEGIALDYDRFSTNSASESLRDGFLASSNSVDVMVSDDLFNALCSNIERQIDRLVMRSQTIALSLFKKKKRDAVSVAWDAVLIFVSPLVDSLGDEEQVLMIKSMVLSKRNLMKTACEGLLTHAWMSPGSSRAPVAYIHRTSNFFSAFLKLQKDIDQEAKKKLEATEGKVVSTTNTSVSKTRMSLEVACRAAKCHQLLTTIGEYEVVEAYMYYTVNDVKLISAIINGKGSEKNITVNDSRLIQELSEEAIRVLKSQSRSKYLPELDAKFGVPFLLFLSCWSGLHHSPWSCFNISQARSIMRHVHTNMKHAEEIWGRKLTFIEETLLYIGEADSESGFLSGGMSAIAKKLYDSSLTRLVQNDKDPMHTLLKAHCASCNARLQLIDTIEDSHWVQSAETVKTSMGELQQILTCMSDPSYFYLWRETSSLQSSIEYHILLKMQLVAELLLEGKRPQDAKGFLEDASKDSPQNYDVAFSYGSFLLQMALYNTDFESPGILQKAQRQLLKAAKLNVNKVDPFALLGFWYEVQNDTKRAVGCYSKALLIDPSHPVAGRGILRLKSSRDVSTLRNNAMNQSIFQNGWAWKSLGDSKAFVEGDDERAVLCYQQALRARDIGSPKQHRLNPFFALPSRGVDSEYRECGSTWASLGGCYRRLGKHSASVRAFQSASDNFPSDLSYFCSWAQVELELGLLDEAAEKFQKVLNSDDAITQYSAAHGLASCMLVFARQAAEEGKFGDALSCLKKGINSLSTFTENKVVFCCVWKLLGDLHSHGSIIPASVFVDKNTDVDNENKHKMNFIAQGEDAYMHIISSIENIQDSERANEMTSLRTIALNDLAINLFLRARLRSEYLHEGSGIGPSTSRIDVSNDEECQRLLDLSMKYFISAIELDPLLPMSWCGLGTALVSKDPILAQHAFCRALQLDKSTEDAWANLSLLFFDHNNIVPSEEAVDSLTQVADSAIMWIVRGLLLEKQFKVNQDTESVFSKASDAYRASLQISRHQAAYLGLSLTSRRLDVIGNIVSGDYVMEANKIATKESHANLQMFLNSSSGCNLGALTLDGIMTCEKSLTLQGHDNFLSEQAKTFLQTGKDILVESQMKIAELPGTRALGSKDSAAVQMSNAGLVMKASSFVLKEDVDQIVSSFLDVADNALKSVCSDCSVLRGSESISISMARQNVIQNPDCGLMWLDLSKALLRALTSGVTDESSAIVKTTMQKTKQIMVACATDAPLLHPTSKGSSTVLKSIPSTPVESTKLSEAFALSDWIEDIASESHNNCAYDLQRAVLLDPENFFARSKIDE